MLDPGWVPLESASVEPPSLCSKSSAPFTGGLPSSGGPTFRQLGPVPASLAVMGMSHQTFQRSLKSLFLLPFLQALTPCHRKKYDRFDVICS